MSVRICKILAKQEEFVTEQTLDTDKTSVTDKSIPNSAESSHLENSSSTPPNTSWPSPVVYPLRPPKAKSRYGAIELLTLPQLQQPLAGPGVRNYSKT